MQGSKTATVSFTDAEGAPLLVDVNSKFLAVSTTTGVIKIFDVSRSTPKQLSAGRVEDPKTGVSLGEIRSLRCNCDGTRVSLLSSKKISERSRCVDVYCTSCCGCVRQMTVCSVPRYFPVV